MKSYGKRILLICCTVSILFLIPESLESIEHHYEIKLHNGTPTLFINGSPMFYGVWWCPAPTAENWVRSEFAQKNAADTGIHIYAFDVGPQEWRGPEEGRSGFFDFSTVETRLRHILRADPNALFHYAPFD